MRQRNASQDPVTITRVQLVDWAARLARVTYETENDHASGVTLAGAQEIRTAAPELDGLEVPA